MLPGESRYSKVDGVNIHYVVAGGGPPVLLLHGLGASVITWRDNIGPLSQSFTVYAIDLPGHGYSDKPDWDYSPDSLLSLMTHFLDSLGIDRCSLIGNSGGGFLALKLALDYSQKVEGLVLVDSAGLGRELPLYIRLVTIPLLGNVLESAKIGGVGYMLRKVFYDQGFVTNGLLHELYQSHSMPGAREAVVRSVRYGASPWGLRKRVLLLDSLKDLQVPLLLVWGAEDQIIPVSHAYDALREALKAKPPSQGLGDAIQTSQKVGSDGEVPLARLKVFERCGHWPHMEKAQEFNELVLNFLSSDFQSRMGK
ncbi:MAG: alpha/beta fold hydrolase [Chloroflexi bacterium]|nr:alpha/beta fold hydrolase [Chloroflexota bacterium]